ncbi:MAG: 4-hydroxyphenylpyruvate dioxygenase [Elainellaceae cyanobacterium]
MNFSHVHLYVDDAVKWQRWFVDLLGFVPARKRQAIPFLNQPQTQTLAVSAGRTCFVLSSPLGVDSPAAQYLQRHPPGVADLAFYVDSLDEVLASALAEGAKRSSSVTTAVMDDVPCRWVRISGWGDLCHTLIETRYPTPPPEVSQQKAPHISAMDHAVLNVPQGEMATATSWYEAAFNLRRHQAFTIQTEHSALYSQVLKHPKGDLQLPINEPTSPTSQIQEFLDVNRGAGIQHIALQTSDIVAVVRRLRQQGLAFLTVPESYYETLPQRAGFSLSSAQQQAIAEQQILVDWQAGQPQTMLFQTFTRPIFDEPTFFFELIQRQTYDLRGVPQYATGFGEGNFQALFEAMEREQMQRGSL